MMRLLEKLREALESGTLVKLTLGHPQTPEGAQRLLARPVLIRGERRVAVVSRFATRDETKNFTEPEFVELVAARLGDDFRSAHLFTQTEETQFDGRRLRVRPVARPPAALGHDRLKTRRLNPAARYLVELGVSDAQGRVRERMGDKLRQIERFLDLLASAYRESGLEQAAKEPLEVVDMGAGKGYLTFAAADDFARGAGRPVRVTGVEARPELVMLCNAVAQRCGLAERLRFVEGRIGQTPLEKVDILIALHACNTATDDALAAGVRAGAQVILAAPCCHKELRPQVDAVASSGPLRDLLRYGLFAERHTEMATDALRALLLEREGYKVRVAEFVAAEHTAKNVMLLATRRGAPLQGAARAELEARVKELKAFYGIGKHHLEEALGD